MKNKKPENTPEVRYTTLGISDWIPGADEYMIIYGDNPRYVGEIETPDGAEYYLHDRWDKKQDQNNPRRTAVAVDNPPAFIADPESDDLEIDGYNLKDFVIWCITNDEDLEEDEKSELLGK